MQISWACAQFISALSGYIMNLGMFGRRRQFCCRGIELTTMKDGLVPKNWTPFLERYVTCYIRIKY